MLLWTAEDRLEADASRAIAEAEIVYVSAATIWEIEIKRAVGRLRTPRDVMALVDESGFERLPISFEHASEAGRLPLLHRDPFDRMLVAQSRREGLMLATGDEAIADYEVPVFRVHAA